MGKANAALLAFNRGVMSPLGLARTDLKRTALSAEQQENFMPRTLGSMMLRPGTAYIDSTRGNVQAIHIPFIFSASDTAIIELTDSTMRVRLSEAVIQRVSVASTITNGTFDSNLTGWTSADQTGATSSWATGGYMSLVGTTYNAAIRYQQVAVAGADQGKEHALRIVVARGVVKLRVGSTNGGDDYITETDLAQGTYSLALTPSGSFYIQLSSYTLYASLVDSVTLEAAGEMTLPTPWPAASLQYIRWDQSADVIFIACDGYLQRRIERRATRSWSVVNYYTNDGPFRTINTGPITLTPSAISGDITLTASASLFRSTHVGALFRITSIGQSVSSSLSGENQFTNSIRVTGIGSQRTFTLTLSGTWSATVTLQRSTDNATWTDVNTYTVNQTTNYSDGLDNQILYYRIGVKTGGYTSGTVVASLTYTNGSLNGVVRITAYSSATSVSAAVLTPLGGTAASALWSEGEWSDYRGYPTSLAFFEGRLWWAGRDKIWGSVSDAFASFDDTTTGDSGPISRSIGSGPVDRINWILPLQRLLLGGDGAEHSVRSSSLDEPLTPTNFNIRSPSTQGSSAVGAVKVDARGIFVDRGGTRIFAMAIDNPVYSYDYQSGNLTVFCPEIGEPGITRLAVQRRPDTRIHCVRSDGAVVVLVFDPAEDVQCFVPITTDGVVEDVFVLPGTIEDSVYYVVNRTINGSTKRYLERWALESECVGGTTSKNIDCHLVYTGAPTTTLSAPHLATKTIVVWADGKDQGSYTADGSGNITLTTAVSNAVYGLSYTAKFKSVKLAYAAQGGTALTQVKRVDHLGVILRNTHYQGLKYGPDFDNLDDLPLVEDGKITDADYVWGAYDKEMFEFDGIYDTDSRLCLQAQSPRPCTVLAAVLGIATHEKG